MIGYNINIKNFSEMVHFEEFIKWPENLLSHCIIEWVFHSRVEQFFLNNVTRWRLMISYHTQPF